MRGTLRIIKLSENIFIPLFIISRNSEMFFALTFYHRVYTYKKHNKKISGARSATEKYLNTLRVMLRTYYQSLSDLD